MWYILSCSLLFVCVLQPSFSYRNGCKTSYRIDTIQWKVCPQMLVKIVIAKQLLQNGISESKVDTFKCVIGTTVLPVTLGLFFLTLIMLFILWLFHIFILSNSIFF